jgi:type IV pilus assembly protein PilN
MAHINLLPWRETLRKQRQQEFGIAALGAAAFAGLVLFGVHLQMEAMIEFQKQRNGFLKSEIAIMDKKIEEIKKLEKTKEQLLARMNIIQRLQQSRPLVVHLFDELVKTIPDGVVIESISQTGKKVVIQGIAESNTRVSAFMRNVEASEWLEAPALEIISGDAKGRGDTASSNKFTLQVALKSDEQEEAVAKKDDKKKRRKR